mmetsp:Transcript_13427/g.25068  ORF Transcript_13427/g.25068 Transcript_13427/m.25068 type:complete len:204 (+) Transcript_13427:1563-2174(+)
MSASAPLSSSSSSSGPPPRSRTAPSFSSSFSSSLPLTPSSFCCAASSSSASASLATVSSSSFRPRGAARRKTSRPSATALSALFRTFRVVLADRYEAIHVTNVPSIHRRKDEALGEGYHRVYMIAEGPSVVPTLAVLAVPASVSASFRVAPWAMVANRLGITTCSAPSSARDGSPFMSMCMSQAQHASMVPLSSSSFPVSRHR